MKHLLRTILFISIFILSTVNVFARESEFIPAFGEVNNSWPGKERILVGQEGNINILSSDTSQINLYPITISNAVYVSSPILADIDGDQLDKEIIVTARNEQNQYSLKVYDGDGVLIHEIPLPSATYYDPVAVNNQSQPADEILVPLVSGELLKISLQSNQLISSPLINVSQPVGVAVMEDLHTVILNFPQGNNLQVYDFQSTGLSLQNTITSSSPIIYPVNEYAASSEIYGITNANELIGFNLSSGAPLTGLPQTIVSGVALDSPLALELSSANFGVELFIPLSDGSTAIYSKLGLPIGKLYDQSYLNSALNALDSSQNGIFTAVHNLSIHLKSDSKDIVSSTFSNIRILLAGSNFDNLSVSKNSVIADDTDLQTASLVLNTFTPESVAGADIIINYNATSNPQMGFFRMTQSAPGVYSFAETGTHGSNLVRLDPAASNIQINPLAGTMTVNFIWSTLTSVGNTTDNDIWVRFTEAGQTTQWQRIETNYSTVAPSVVDSFSLAKNSVLVDNFDTQTASMLIVTAQPESITEARIAINLYHETNPQMGFFRMIQSSPGVYTFSKVGTHGATLVNLDSAASSVVVDQAAGTMIVNFVWTIVPETGALIANDVWTGKFVNGNFGGWIRSGVLFDTIVPTGVNPNAPAAYNSFSISTPTIAANGTDSQNASLVINTAHPETLTMARIIVNLYHETNAQQGYFVMTQTFPGIYSFTKIGTHGASLVNFDATASSVQIDAANNTMTINFSWSILPSAGTSTNNDIWAGFSDALPNGNVPFSGWIRTGALFDVI